MTDDSDDNLFLRQSKFSQDTFTESDINSDFEHLLDSDISDINFVVSGQDDFDQNNSSDEELLRATQNFEKAREQLPENVLNKESESRLGTPLTVEEISNLERLAKNKHTEKKSQWAVRVFDAWYLERKGVSSGLGQCLLNLSDDELCRHMVSFITEVKNQKGEEYHGNTINEILSSIQYFLRQNGKDINIFSDYEFAAVRRILDAKMKALARRRIGIHKRKADVLTRRQEEILWEMGILGEDTPQKLLDTVFYLNGICFCLRGGAEHHDLSVGEFGNFEIIMKNGAKHLRYLEGVTKTNNGGLNHKNIPKKCVTVGPNTENPFRCPVRFHEKYMSLRPANCSAFYLRPLKYQRLDLWYFASPIGRQTLGGTMRRLCRAAGFESYYTNHSLRATTATRLYESGLDEQLIAERTGHRSSAIRGYKRTSEDMLQVVDDVVQGKVTNDADTRPLGPKFFVASSSPSTCVTEKRFPTLPNIGTAVSTAESTVGDVSNAPISFTVERSGAKVTFQM